MKNELTKEQLTELESQLSCPQGENGIEVAEQMHKTNISMTTAAFKALNIQDGHQLLELGHGSCKHLPQLLKEARGLHYNGLDISETMYQEAVRINQQWIDQKVAHYQLYDGTHIPFEEAQFDRAMTINTIYFWEEPLILLQEINKVLKPEGVVAIAFVQKEFMLGLPFVGEKFNLFDSQTIEELAIKSNFIMEEIFDHTETVESKLGDFTNRSFSVAVLRKQAS